MKNFLRKIHFDCTKEILQQYDCRCGNFKTNLFIHLWKHLQEKHMPVNEPTVQVHKCACSLESHSQYLILRHQFFDKYSAVKSKPQQKIQGKHDSVKKQYKCKQCNFKSNWNWCLHRHVFQKHAVLCDSQWHQCKQCPKKYKLKQDLTRHIRLKHSNVEWYRCEECPKKFRIESNLTRHVEVHPKQPIFSCKHCNYQTKWERDLAMHVLRKHAHLPEIEWHQCEQCPKKFKIKKDLKLHVMRNHCESVFKCEQCSYQAKNLRSLTEHNTAKHVKLSEIEWYECTHCPKKYKIRRALKKHVTKKHLKQVLKCEQCSFQTNDKLCLTHHVTRKHIKVPETEWHQCEHCPKRFKVRNDLSGHVRRLHSSVVFKCEQCSFQTRRQFWLTEHYTREHAQLSEIEWHQCEHCPIRFKVKRDLIKHSRLNHSNDIYDCKQCDFKSKWKHCLTRHILRKH